MKEGGGYIWIGIGAVIGAAVGFFVVHSYELKVFSEDNLEFVGIFLFLILWSGFYFGGPGEDEDGRKRDGCMCAIFALIITIVIVLLLNYAVGVGVGALIGACISAIIFKVFKALQDS